MGNARTERWRQKKQREAMPSRAGRPLRRRVRRCAYSASRRREQQANSCAHFWSASKRSASVSITQAGSAVFPPERQNVNGDVPVSDECGSGDSCEKESKESTSINRSMHRTKSRRPCVSLLCAMFATSLHSFIHQHHHTILRENRRPAQPSKREGHCRAATPQ